MRGMPTRILTAIADEQATAAKSENERDTSARPSASLQLVCSARCGTTRRPEFHQHAHKHRSRQCPDMFCGLTIPPPTGEDSPQTARELTAKSISSEQADKTPEGASNAWERRKKFNNAFSNHARLI